MHGRSIDWFRVALIAALIASAAVIIAINLNPIAPNWKPEVWAAWVQAIGSIAAILAAVFLALWQRSVEARARRQAESLEARGLSMALLRDASDLRNRLYDERNMLNSFGPHAEGWKVAGPLIPQNLWERVRELHKLGPAGGDLLSSIFWIQKSRDHLDGGFLFAEHLPQYKDCIENAYSHTSDALFAMNYMLR